MKLKHLLAMSFCLLLTACASESGPSDVPTIMSQQETSAPMGQRYQMAENTGDPEGQYRTGMRYLLGQGTPINYSSAHHWLSQSASSNNPYAENELGYMYLAGLGVSPNQQEAFSWYKKAAVHGLASAQYNLGLMYQNGIGTPADKAQAKSWFAKAAAQGFGPAHHKNA